MLSAEAETEITEGGRDASEVFSGKCACLTSMRARVRIPSSHTHTKCIPVIQWTSWLARLDRWAMDASVCEMETDGGVHVMSAYTCTCTELKWIYLPCLPNEASVGEMDSMETLLEHRVYPKASTVAYFPLSLRPHRESNGDSFIYCYCLFVFSKISPGVLEKWLGSYEHLLLLQRTRAQF